MILLHNQNGCETLCLVARKISKLLYLGFPVLKYYHFLMQLVTRCQLVSKMVRFLMGTSHLPLHSTVTTPHGWVDLITKREGEIRERGQQRRMTNDNGCSLIWVNQLWLRRPGHRDVRIITNGSQVIRFTLEMTEFGLYLIRKEGASRWVCIEER